MSKLTAHGGRPVAERRPLRSPTRRRLFRPGAVARPRRVPVPRDRGASTSAWARDLAMAFDAARAVWDHAAGLPAVDGGRLHEIVFPRPAFTAEERQRQSDALTATGGRSRRWPPPAWRSSLSFGLPG